MNLHCIFYVNALIVKVLFIMYQISREIQNVFRTLSDLFWYLNSISQMDTRIGIEWALGFWGLSQMPCERRILLLPSWQRQQVVIMVVRSHQNGSWRILTMFTDVTRQHPWWCTIEKDQSSKFLLFEIDYVNRKNMITTHWPYRCGNYVHKFSLGSNYSKFHLPHDATLLDEGLTLCFDMDI